MIILSTATSTLQVSRFYCKIHESNAASRALFHSYVIPIDVILMNVSQTNATFRLGYQECNYVKAFEEYELELFPQQEMQRIVDDILTFARVHNTISIEN